MQQKRVEPERVLGVKQSPIPVLNFGKRLQRVLITRPSFDQTLCSLFRLVGAKVRCFQDCTQIALRKAFSDLRAFVTPPVTPQRVFMP